MVLMYVIVMSSSLEMAIQKRKRLHDMVYVLELGSLIFCRWTSVDASRMG